jgi:hypothetical protein
MQGSIEVSAQSSFEGVEVLYRRALLRDCAWQVDFLAGYRFNRLSDELLVKDSKRITGTGTAFVVGTTVEEFDRFETRNVFQGGVVGLIAERRWCCWSFELATKLALGNNHARTSIDGSTTVTVPLAAGGSDVSVTPAGLLAQQTNIGIHENDEFAAIPEIGIMVGYDLTSNLRATLGYTFLYWSTVARPGDQIDTRLNLSQLEPTGLVGPARPSFPGVSTGVWMQGMSVGLDYRF